MTVFNFNQQFQKEIVAYMILTLDGQVYSQLNYLVYLFIVQKQLR